MSEIPKFRLYGEDDSSVQEAIQPRLPLRNWEDLTREERDIVCQQLKNFYWVDEESPNILQTIRELNSQYLRVLPGKMLHGIKPCFNNDGSFSNLRELEEAAYNDFILILVNERSGHLVLKMFTILAKSYIDDICYELASEAENEEERNKWISKAFRNFDAFAKCVNHILDQFSVNLSFTRNGLVPLQDKKIFNDIYKPTLKILSDPKWRNISDDLSRMFTAFQEQSYAEVITDAHRAVQRYLQIIAGEEGKSGKGEVGKLFSKVKREGLIPANVFTERIIDVFQQFFASERAQKSTAKPSLKETTQLDALLVMNVTIVFLQYCLQSKK